MEIPEGYISNRETAKLLNITENYLYMLISKGKITRYKLPNGHKNLFKKSDVEALLKPAIK